MGFMKWTFLKGGVLKIHKEQENDKYVKWAPISRKMTENPQIFGATRQNKAYITLNVV